MGSKQLQLIEEIKNRLSILNPDRIILFGSHAHGSAGADSDIDLIVVLNKEEYRMYILLTFLMLTFFSFFFVDAESVSAATLRVPQNYPSLMAAYDAAKDGDEILVAPGTYPTCLSAKTKRIKLRAEFPATTSPLSQQSILKSSCPDVIEFSTPLTTDGKFLPGNHFEFAGFVLNGGNDGFSYEKASGIIKDNIIQGQTDDPIDIDGPSEAHVIGNILRDGRDEGDGIENRLHGFSSSRTIKMVFMDNIIYNNPHNGIQLINEESAVTPRKYLVANNLIIRNKHAGFGTTKGGSSSQSAAGYALQEEIYIINNTFVGNGRGGIIGGGNSRVHNNIFYQNGPVGVRNVSGKSVVSHNLFFGNKADYEGSNVQKPNVFADPKFINTQTSPGFNSYLLGSGSPAIDAGLNIDSLYREFGVTPPSFSGKAPDLGWKESGSTSP